MQQPKMTQADRGNEPPAHSHPATRGLWALSFAVLATIACLAVLATPAWAVEGHVYSKTFGAGELSLESQSALALDQDSGELYVADTGNSRVAKYTAAGLPDGTFATLPTPTFLAVDNSTGASNGDVYVVNTNRTQISKFDPAGLPIAAWGTAGVLGGLGSIAGIATDPQGNLRVLNTEAILRQFEPGGTQISQTSPPELFGSAVPQGIAVDGEDNLYAWRGKGVATSFTKAGTNIVFGYEPTSPGALAVDDTDGDLYAASGGADCRFGLPRFHRPPAPANVLTPFENFSRCGAPSEAINGSGITVREANSEVFVATDGVIKDYIVEDVAPPVVSIEAPTAVTTTSAHVLGHINPESPAANPPSYDVQWKFSCAPESCVGAEGSISADDQDHIVEGTLEGLEPGTKYNATLTASNVLNRAEASVTFKTAPIAPEVLNESATSIFPTEATLHALIRPRGAATTYRFEYVPEAAFLAGGFASPETRSTGELGPIDEEVSRQEISASVDGLTPGTPYRFRVVATNSVGTTFGDASALRTQNSLPAPEIDCPNQAYRGGLGALLPDCRAYEMVTPVDKGGLAAEGFLDYFAAAEDGSGVTYFSQSASGMPASGGAHQEFVTMMATRNGSGWSDQRLLPPEELGVRANFLGASQDFRFALLEGCVPGFGPGTGCALYLEETATQSLVEVVPHEDNQLDGPGYGFGTYAYDSISSDGALVFFETKAHLTADAAPEKDNLYSWERASGQVRLVGALPGPTEKAPPGGSFGGAYEWSTKKPSTLNGGALNGEYVEAIHAISAEGDKAYFTAGQTGQLYLRRNLTGPKPSTLQVNTPEAGVTDPNGTQPAAFLEATPDGRFAFFLSSQKLTKDASTGVSDGGRDLYRFDAATRELVDVTPDTAATDLNGAEVQGLLGASASGTTGYFAAKGVLVDGGTSGETNLYRFQEAASGKFLYRFIGVAPSPLNWSPISSGRAISVGNEEYRTSRVTPDGDTLVYAKAGPSGTQQLYWYSTDRGGPYCVSCNPTGERSNGPAALSTDVLNAHLPPRGLIEQRLTRNLTPDGNRLFFNSPDPLVAGDSNGTPRCTYFEEGAGSGNNIPDCEDVYEWEAPGSPGGSCHTEEVNHGCLYLLSGGKSKQASNLVDVSADGKDAFIATASPLVPIDRDSLTDVYDVGIDRGVASQQSTPVPPCASSEACQDPPSGSPPGSSAGTATFHGPGNQSPKDSTCKKKKGAGRKGAKKQCTKKSGKNHKTRNHKPKAGGRKKQRDHRSGAGKGGKR
jgi:NHL repeat